MGTLMMKREHCSGGLMGERKQSVNNRTRDDVKDFLRLAPAVQLLYGDGALDRCFSSRKRRFVTKPGAWTLQPTSSGSSHRRLHYRDPRHSPS